MHVHGAARHLRVRPGSQWGWAGGPGAEELGKFLANFALTYSNLTAQAIFSQLFARRQIWRDLYLSQAGTGGAGAAMPMGAAAAPRPPAPAGPAGPSRPMR